MVYVNEDIGKCQNINCMYLVILFYADTYGKSFISCGCFDDMKNIVFGLNSNCIIIVVFDYEKI